MNTNHPAGTWHHNCWGYVVWTDRRFDLSRAMEPRNLLQMECDNAKVQWQRTYHRRRMGLNRTGIGLVLFTLGCALAAWLLLG